MFDILRKKRGMKLKLCPQMEYEEKTFLWKNHAENLHQKLFPDPFIILVNKPKQPLHARNYLKSKIFLKEDY